MYFVVIDIFQIIYIPFFFLNHMIIWKRQNIIKRKGKEMVVQYMQPQMANLDVLSLINLPHLVLPPPPTSCLVTKVGISSTWPCDNW